MENQEFAGQSTTGASAVNSAQCTEVGMEHRNKESHAASDKHTSEVAELAQELEVQRELAKENYEKFLRLTAEFDNHRKRVERERSELLRFGHEKLLGELLPVVDSFHKAAQAHISAATNAEAKGFIDGVLLILKQLSAVLEKNGLKEISAAGAPFDPNFHQAIQRIECDKTETETVHEEYVKGYLLHDRLLRPAMVSVKVPSAAKEN